MRRTSSDSLKEPKGILKTQTKYGVPISPAIEQQKQQNQSKYETVLKQNSNSVLQKERELKQLQQKQNTNQSNNSIHNQSSSSIGSTSKQNIQSQSISTNQRPSAIQQLIGLNSSTEGQKRSSRLNDQILELSKGSRGADQSPLNVNQSHVINNSIHAYVNHQNQISNQSHSPHNHDQNQNITSTGGGGINSAAVTMNAIFNQVTLKDLCPEDKFKVGQLMKKLAEEKQQKEILLQKLQLNDNIHREQINYIQKEKQSIIENSQVLKDRFQQSIKLLQNYRDRSAERSSPGEQIKQENQYVTPSSHQYKQNSQIDNNNISKNQSNQHVQRKSSTSNKSFVQIAGDQGEAEQLALKQKQSSSQIKFINNSNNDIPVSSFNNIPTKDMRETNEIQNKQKQKSQQSDQSISSSQAIKHDDNEEDEKISRQSRISKQEDKQDEDKKLFENNQKEDQQYEEQKNDDDKQHQQHSSQNSQHLLYNTNQQFSINNLQSKNDNSNKDLKQFQQPPYFMDSLDQEVQEFLAQSIPNHLNKGTTDHQKINQADQLNSNPLFRNSLSPLHSGYRSNFYSATQGSPSNLQTNSLYQGSISSPVSQNQLVQNSFSKYVNKNVSTDIYNKKQISNSDLLKSKSQLKYQLSPHQKSQQQSVKSYSFQNNGQKLSELQVINENAQSLRNPQTLNEYTQHQSERITLRMKTGESEKMFNQWKQQYTNQTSDETVLNSPYKNQPFNQRVKQIEEDDTKTFQDIQNLRSQMQNLVSQLKQISLNKPANHQQSNSQKQINSEQNQHSHRNTLPNHVKFEKGQEQQIHQIQSSSKLNPIKNKPLNNQGNEKFSDTRDTLSHQRKDSQQNNEKINIINNYKNQNNDEESSEDDEQIEIVKKFLNLKKQKLLSQMQDIRKDDFLDSNCQEDSIINLESQKLSTKHQQKEYDLPLQVLYSDYAPNINASASHHIEKPQKYYNENNQKNPKDNKHLQSYQGDKSYLTPSHHHHNNIQKVGNSPQPQTLTQNIVVTTSRKSSPQLNHETVHQDSRFATTSNPETYNRITSRNFTNRANMGGNVSNTGGLLNLQIQSLINTSNTNNLMLNTKY